MHDLDRAMFEAGLGGEQEYGYESAELEQEEFLNVLGEVLGQSNGASPQAPPRGVLERRASAAPPRSSAQDETEEMELALELLQVSNEEELGNLFAGLVKGATKAAGTASRLYQSRVAPHLTDILKTAAGGLVPAAGQALGSVAFGKTGGEWGKAAGEALKSFADWELEGLSQEDREFETARALVHWAKDAAQRAAAMTPQAAARPSAASGATRQVPPAQVAKAAAVTAAQRVAPGLAEVVRQIPVPSTGAGGPATAEQSGRWTRRGNTVVLHGF